MADDATQSPAPHEPPPPTRRSRSVPPEHHGHTGRRIAAIVLGTIVLLAGLAVATVYVLSNTDWGREKVRGKIVSILNETMHGRFTVGRVTGNLLEGLTVHDVVITDSAGGPFLRLDSASTRYGLRTFFSKKIDLSGLTLYRPVVVLDRPPNGTWNWARIFFADTTKGAPNDSTKIGFGDWVVFHDVKVRDGDITVRIPWRPDTSLATAARDSAIRVTLDTTTVVPRQRVVRVAGGFQQMQVYHHLTGVFPLVQLAKPHDGKVRRIEIDSLRVAAFPFRLPGAEVRQARGLLLVTTDSLWFRDIALGLPNTRASLTGRYGLNSGDLEIAGHAAPTDLHDVRFLYPALPDTGSATLDFRVGLFGNGNLVLRFANLDMRSRATTMQGDLGLSFRPLLRMDTTNLRFTGLTTALLQQLVPAAKSPRPGVLSGRLAADGPLADLALDGDVAFDDPRTGQSRIVALGRVGMSDDGVVRATGLHVRLQPVQVALARIAMPTLPIGGIVTGVATLNGSTDTRLELSAMDLTLLDRGERSRAVGRAAVALGATPTEPVPGSPSLRRDASSPAPPRSRARVVGRGRGPWFDIDVTTQPLSLVTAGRFAPAIGLRGSARGPIRVRGTTEAMTIGTELTLSDGGRLDVNGSLGMGTVPTYDLRARMALFNANAVVAKAPRTSLTASAALRGRGSDPATMIAALSADLSTSSVDTVKIDSSTIRLRVGGGLLSIDTLGARAPGTAVFAKGTFGLRAGRSGELSYRADVDSLAGLARYIPRLTGNVEPRPAILAERLARSRADSARNAQRNAVRIAAGAERALPSIPVDTPHTIAKDSLAGSVYAAGVLRGGIKGFDVRGRAGALNLIALGNSVRRTRVAYTGMNVLTAEQSFAVAGVADSVLAAGFALDSVDVRGTYREPGGNVQVAVYQNHGSDVQARADYGIYTDRKELLLGRLVVRFDTTLWAATHASAVRWGQPGVEIDKLELLNGVGGRMFVDGRLPTAGPANLRVQLENFQVADVVSLLQSDVPVRALAGIDATLTGTLAAPVIHGKTTLDSVSYLGTGLPDLDATLDYADRRLAARAQLLTIDQVVAPTARRGRRAAAAAVADTAKAVDHVLAEITGSVPIDLGLQGVTGARLADDAPIVADFRIDSLPIDLAERFTDVVSNVKGIVRGSGTVRGTIKKPDLKGDVVLADAAFRIVDAGVLLRDVNGAMHLRGDTVVVDSVAGRAGAARTRAGRLDGRILLQGGIGVKTLATPSFDLRLTADNARVLDNELGRINADAQISMYGPYDGLFVSGGARVRGGVIYVPESDKKQVISSGDPTVFAVLDTTRLRDTELVPAQSPLLANLRTDVFLSVDRDTWVRSREANVEIFSDGDLRVRVDRANQAIVLDGIVDTDRGQYTFLSKRFQVKSGSATFIGTQELNPNLQVVAEYEVREGGRPLAIRILIGGNLLAPRIALESDAQPPLSQSDLLSRLAFGSNTGQLLQLGGGSSVSASSTGGGLVGTTAALARKQLTGIVTGVLVDDLENKTGRSLGADVFNITPVAGLPEELAGGNFGSGLEQFVRGTQVEFGKYFNRQLYVAFQATPIFFESAPYVPGFVVQYRFANLLGLILESNWQPRYFLPPPSLSQQSVDAKNAFGLFLVRNWKF